MTYDEVISYIYEHRKPGEDYSQTLRRLEHPLVPHLYDAPQCQQLITALEQFGKQHKAEDPRLKMILGRLAAGSALLAAEDYRKYEHLFPTIRSAHFTQDKQHVRVKLM